MQQVIHLAEPLTRPEIDRDGRRAADLLRPHRGRVVARLSGEILLAADTPAEVVGWLREHHIDGAAVFRVPVDPAVDPGGTTA